jgi:hypothetical protein
VGSIFLCLVAFLAVFWLGRRSFIAGLSGALSVGYVYGIVRANLPQAFSHFIFDAAIGGLYLAIWSNGLTPIQRLRVRKVRGWAVWLIGWPMLLFFVPVQDPLIQLVGLRGAAWFVPFLMLGALIDDDGRSRLALWLAGLNVLALGFAVAEFSFGLPSFYPHNAATYLIYMQNDAIPGATSAYRIPAIFPTQAGYSATMVLSMPLLAGAFVQEKCTRHQKILLGSGMAAAMAGIFLGASRSQAIMFFAQLISLATFAKIRMKHLIAFAIFAALVGRWIYEQPRLQRFTQLDTNLVEERVHWSVNESFLGALTDYPLGNGLGGGGTSIPYFLESRIRNPVAIENEYGRILLETGIPGLGLWLAFAIVAIGTAPSDRAGPWRVGWRMARVTSALYFATAFLGTGLLTAIPGTTLLLFHTGWLCAPRLRRFRITAEEAETWAQPALG